jgi:hypothetical protein
MQVAVTVVQSGLRRSRGHTPSGASRFWVCEYRGLAAKGNGEGSAASGAFHRAPEGKDPHPAGFAGHLLP